MHQKNLVAVRTIFPAGFDQMEESYCYNKVQFKKIFLPNMEKKKKRFLSAESFAMKSQWFKDVFQSVLCTLESLYVFFVLFHIRHPNIYTFLN